MLPLHSYVPVFHLLLLARWANSRDSEDLQPSLRSDVYLHVSGMEKIRSRRKAVLTSLGGPIMANFKREALLSFLLPVLFVLATLLALKILDLVRGR